MVRGLLSAILTVTLLGASTAFSAESCGSIFVAGPYHDVVLEKALDKAIGNDIKGLSSRDLEYLVEKVFRREEGRRYKLSDYWKKSHEERVNTDLERRIAEAVTHRGILKYFEDHGYLNDRDRVMTKLIQVNRSRTFNALSAVWTAVSVTKGGIPAFLPEATLNLKPADFNILILKGIDSPEGQAIFKKYGWKQELNRGYEIFSRYYTPVALTVFLYIFYDKAEDFIKKHRKSPDENPFDTLYAEAERRLTEGIF